MNYEHVSHAHCWKQEQPSACSIPFEKHTQCCLCDLPLPEEVTIYLSKAVDSMKNDYDAKCPDCNPEEEEPLAV